MAQNPEEFRPSGWEPQLGGSPIEGVETFRIMGREIAVSLSDLIVEEFRPRVSVQTASVEAPWIIRTSLVFTPVDSSNALFLTARKEAFYDSEFTTHPELRIHPDWPTEASVSPSPMEGPYVHRAITILGRHFNFLGIKYLEVPTRNLFVTQHSTTETLTYLHVSGSIHGLKPQKCEVLFFLRPR